MFGALGVHSMINKIFTVLILSFLLTKTVLASEMASIIKSIPPNGYEINKNNDMDDVISFIKYGDVNKALKSANIDKKYDQSFIEGWFKDDQISLLNIKVLNIPKEFDSAIKFQKYIGDSLKSKWGEFSRFHIDPNSGIGYFFNNAGAMVHISTKIIKDQVVMIVSYDFAGMLADENKPFPLSKEPSALINRFKASGNFNEVNDFYKSLESRLNNYDS